MMQRHFPGFLLMVLGACTVFAARSPASGQAVRQCSEEEHSKRLAFIATSTRSFQAAAEAKAIGNVAGALLSKNKEGLVTGLLELIVSKRPFAQAEQLRKASLFIACGRIDSAQVYISVLRQKLGAAASPTLASLHRFVGRSDLVIADLGTSKSDSPETHLEKARAFAAYLGRLDSARVHYYAALKDLGYYGQNFQKKSIPDRILATEALHGLGDLWLEADEPESAANYFRQALKNDPGQRIATGKRMQEDPTKKTIFGQPKKEEVTFQYVMRDSSRILDLLAALTNAFEAAGETDSARVYYGVFRHAAPKNVYQFRILRALARLDVANGNLDGALARIDTAEGFTEIADVRCGLMIERSRIYAQMHRDSAALKNAIDARLLGADGSCARDAMVNLARLYRAHPTIRQPRGAVVALYDSVLTGSDRGESDEERLASTAREAPWVAEWILAVLGTRDTSAAASSLAASERGRGRALLQFLQGADPAYGRTPSEGKPLHEDGVALVRTVPRGSVALVYQVTSDTLVIWQVTGAEKPAIAVTRRAIRSDSLTRLVNVARAGMGSGASVALTQAGESPFARGIGVAAVPGATPERADSALQILRTLLVPNGFDRLVRAGTPLLIVPNGVLNLVPFAALKDGAGKWLGAEFPIRYAPSLAVAASLDQRQLELDSTTTRYGSLVVGNPVMPPAPAMSGGTTLPQLPGAERETQDVADVLKAIPLTGRSGTETLVRKSLSTVRVVHLATHGFAYASQARDRDSFLALGADSRNDGIFTIGELLDDQTINLTADLVVLSACQTGVGVVNPGDGTLGFQRAFLAKGAQSVLVSLWNVSDAATELLMTRFYTHWLNDASHPSRAEALRLAQNDVRATPGFEAPKFWAAFQLVGAP
jgi:tetratricopeptide (TPR) repeat protein